jgi:hypothetical protein
MTYILEVVERADLTIEERRVVAHFG